MPVHSTETGVLAATILDGAIRIPGDEGADVALVDLLRRLDDNGTRQRAVRSYWRLSVAIAEDNFARYETRYLAALGRPQSPLEDSLLSSELAQARARQATTALNVLEWQENLVEVARLELASLPRPVDRPFVGAYRTNFDTLFANRVAPRNLNRINRYLPHQLEIIERRAEAVDAGERAATQLADAYQRRTAELSRVLDSLSQLSRTRRELLAAVVTYNEQIAEYAFAVVRPGLSIESLLGTLIHRDVAAQPAIVADAKVRPASAEAPVVEKPDAVGGTLPLRPAADPQSSLPPEPAATDPTRPSILKRITIDHP